MIQKWKCLFIFCFAAGLMPQTPATAQELLCWKQNFARGAGTIAGNCEYGEDKDAGLCYPGCRSGYTGTGPVCWQGCPSGFTDIGVSCTKPKDITSAGYPWQFGDSLNLDAARKRCEKDWGGGNCYQSGAIIYPKCPSGFHKFGDLVCTPDCPNGMRDDGGFCAKDSYGRGVGKIPSCGAGQQQDAGLCYPSCGNGFDGVGPVCWGQCPSDHPVQCGAACATSKAACGTAIGDIVLNTTSVALNLLSLGAAEGGTSALNAAEKAADTAAGEAILSSTAKSTSGLVFDAAKSYSYAFAKDFIKTSLKNKVTGTNLYWNAAKLLNKGALKGMNIAATEFGVLKDSGTTDLSLLTVLDPTGFSSMIMSFTKYGSCGVDDFLTSTDEVNFGNFSGTQTRTIVLTAQRKMTVTRIATPAMPNCSMAVTADCAGRELSTGQTCNITVSATAPSSLDAEVRIYTNAYTAVPYPIHILGNTNAAIVCTATPGAEEALNATSAAGAWVSGSSPSSSLSSIVTISNGQLHHGSTALDFVPAGDVGRAFRYANQYIYTLDDSREHLTGPITTGPITLPALGTTLDVYYASGDDGAPVVQHVSNGGTNQQFSFEMQSDGTYRIVAQHSGKVLDVWGLSTTPGAQLKQSSWNGGLNQEFRVEPIKDYSYYRIVSAYSGLVLQANGNDSPVTQEIWNDSPGQRFGLTTTGAFFRRPWDAGCQAGETFVAGLCYGVPRNYGVTTPGFMGKVCPYDWRDDGTTCWPPWTGKSVDSVADPNGSSTMRHPLIVTSCTNYSSDKGQNCPANWHHTAVCTCQPDTTSKGVQSIIGRIP